MSIICCRVTEDKIEIAADSILVIESTILNGNYTFDKLFKINNMIIGFAGCVEEANMLKVFSRSTRPKSNKDHDILEFIFDFANWKNEKIDNKEIKNKYILIYDKKAFSIEGFCVMEITNYEAVGAGEDFALAALYLGHSVKKAVEIACTLSTDCTLPVKQYKVKRNK